MKTTEKITINPVRLQWCCEAIDVDIEQFANDIKIAKSDVAESRNKHQQKITCLDELKKSILQKAFSGEL